MHNGGETIDFGVSGEELQWIILAILRQSPRKKYDQKTLFQKVLAHMQMRPRKETRAELLRIYRENLKVLKEQEKIRFYSAKVKTYVVIN